MIIKRPIITEKNNRVQEKLNKYTFEVDVKATKDDVKKALKEMYPTITVTSVNTIVTPSKPKGRFTKGGYVDGRTSVRKKAIVTLKAGDSIDFYGEI
jgi:large subunit ribosomal protein L23